MMRKILPIKQQPQQWRGPFCLLPLMLLLATTSVRAASANFDGRQIPGCSLADNTYRCPASPTSAVDDLLVGSGFTAIVAGTTRAGTAAIAANGTFTGDLLVTSSVALGSYARVTGILSAGSTLAIGANAAVEGNVSSGSTLAMGVSSYVIGSLSAGSSLAMAASTYVTGNATAGTTAFVGDSAHVGGDLQSLAATVTLDTNAYVTGAITADTSVALGAQAHAGGTVMAGSSAALGVNAYVTASVTAATTVFLGAGAYVTGDVTSTTSSAGLGAGAYINGSLKTSTTADLGANAYVFGDLNAGTTATLGASAFTCGSINAPSTVTLGAGAFSSANMQSATVTVAADGYVNGKITATTATLGAGSCYGSIEVTTLTDGGVGVCPLPRPATVCSTMPAPVVPQLDHILITYSGSALTCAPTDLKLTACANAACSQPYYSSGVNLTLMPGGQGATIDTSGVNNTAQIWLTTPGTVTLSSSTAGLAANPTTCRNLADGTANCALTVADTGFQVAVPDHVAETTQNVRIRAVKKADNSTACVPALAGSQKIKLSCRYANPVGGTLPLRLGANIPLAANISASCATDGAEFALDFDATTGTASTALLYADVGQMTLNAALIPSTAATAGLVMTGSAGFIVAPADFSFSQIQQETAPNSLNPAAGTATGPLFLKAGKPFLASVTARNFIGATTQNFGQEQAAESITLSRALVLPTGGAAGTFDFTVPVFNRGMATTRMHWSEVGIITLGAELASRSYLGSAQSASGTSGNVGRFYPDHFDTVTTDGCKDSGFSYAGQPFGVTVTAKNTANVITLNYDGVQDFAKAVLLADASASSVGTLSGTAVAGRSFSNGTAVTARPIFTFGNQATTRQQPITTIAVRATDTDAVTSSGFGEGSMAIRAGRVQLFNAHGSELNTLLMGMQVQYWNGINWARNTADQCSVTPLTPSDAVLISLAPATLACVLDSGNPGRSNAGCSAAAPVSRRFGVTGIAGDFNLGLKVQEAGKAGAVRVTAQVPTWLQFNWGTGVTNPSALATFGIYRAGPVIFMRENY